MRITRTDAFQALQFIRQLIEGEIAGGHSPANQGIRLAPDDYFPVLQRTLEQGKYLFEGKWRVPITYTIQIPVADMTYLEERGLQNELPTALTRKLSDYTKTRGYVTANGAITVMLEAAESESIKVTPDFKPRTITTGQSAPMAKAFPQPAEQSDPHGTVLFKSPVAELEIQSLDDPTVAQRIPLSVFPVTIGREAPENPADIQFEAHVEVSRQHLRIQREGDGAYLVTSLSGLNGTTLNGRNLPPRLPALLPSDSVLILAERVRIRFLEIPEGRRPFGK